MLGVSVWSFMEGGVSSSQLSYPVSYRLLLSMLKSHCPLQEKEVVEDLPKELEEDATAARTRTSQEEVGLEGGAGGCRCPVTLAVQLQASVNHAEMTGFEPKTQVTS